MKPIIPNDILKSMCGSYLLKKFLILLFLLTVAVSTGYAQRNVFVDPINGIDSNTSGSQNSPHRTISNAFANMLNGDIINLRKGVYYESGLQWNKSGTISHPSILQAFENEPVVIDGINTTSQILLFIGSKSNIIVRGIHFTNSKGLNSYGIKIGGNSSNIEITKCVISNIDIDTLNITPSTNALPIKVCANFPDLISNVKIIGNEVFNCKTGFSEGISVAGNVNGFEIIDNYVHDMSNIGIVAAGKYNNDCQGFAQNGRISENRVERCIFPTLVNSSASGIYIDGAENVIVEKNLVSECQVGIQIGCENAGQIAQFDTVRNNLVFHNIRWGLGIGGTFGTVKNSAILNNTSISNNQLTFFDTNGVLRCGNFGEILLKKVENSVIANNLCYTTYSCSNAVFMKWENNGSLTGMTIDYNLYYNPGSTAQPIMVIRNILDSTENIFAFSTYQTWGYDTHSFISNPLLNNPSGLKPEVNFENSASIAINSGINMSASSFGQTDLNGNVRKNNAIDIGAIEYYDCPEFLKLIGVGLSGKIFKATNKIESNATIFNGINNTLYSGKSIILTPGFKADNGSIFKAEIRNCP